MGLLKKLIVVIAVLATAIPMSAQLRFGVKAGLGVNSLKSTEIECVKNNSTGYSFGVMVDYTVPIIGIGVDASVMYARRDTPKSVAFLSDGKNIEVEANMAGKSYLDIPINLKYALSLPALSRIVKPYIATGPSVALNLSENADWAIETKKANVSWNLGAGVELIKHLQLGFNYRWGLGTVSKDDLNFASVRYNLNTNGWQISAAYLF